MANPTMIELLRLALTLKGYTGLCNPPLECGCTLDDFCPCLEMSLPSDCQAGYLHTDGNVYLRRRKKR